MGRFDILKNYVFENTQDDSIWKNRNVLFKLKESDILKYEKKLPVRLPQELIDFYKEIGYGFLRCDVNDYINRFMTPSDIYKFINGIDQYNNDERRTYYRDPNYLVFYEVSEDACLTLDLDKKNEDGECPIYYFDKRIANSINEFITKMEEQADYYIE